MKITPQTVYVCILLSALAASEAAGQSSPPGVAPRSAPHRSRIEGRYSGSWVTTNRKLDGLMTCDVTQLARDRWQGRFWGEWQKVPFDYTVEFAAGAVELPPPMASQRSVQKVALVQNPTRNAVSGTATIDGAQYDWTGILTPNEFNVRFTGTRYEGHFELTRVRQ